MSKLARSIHSRTLDSTANRLSRLRQLSHWLDSAIVLPFVNYRIGLDPILGLIPGGGDIAGMMLSCYILVEAARLGARRSVLGQMSLNIILEMLVGTVPLAGDLWDATWKSNSRNVRLLEDHFKVLPLSARRPNRLFAALLLLAIGIVFIGCISLSLMMLNWLWQRLQGLAG